MQTKAKRALVVGLGKTGLSCARFLHRQGWQVAVTDSRERPPALEALRRELPDVGLFLGGFAPEAFEQAELLVTSPGVSLATPEIQWALAHGVPVVGDVELFAREVAAPVAAITGSNGKSTVTTLLGLMAREAGLQAGVGGNLGEPVLELLDRQAQLYVVELSSFQLETTASLSPAVATVLNVSADHMDRHPSLEAYAQTKARVYQQARIGVYNLDDARVMAMPRTSRAFYFTLGEPRDEQTFGVARQAGEPWLYRGAEPLMPARNLRMPGLHNRANALAALAMGGALGFPLQAMTEVLARFSGLPHRTEHLGVIDGVAWYNDSKGTNPGATVAALEGLAGGDGSRTVLIAGGQGKGADFSVLTDAVREHARAVVLLGEDADRLAQALAGTVPLSKASGMAEAVERAAALARPGDRVLLSPACASFDMFRGFEHRGEVFRRCVEELKS
jgi:UDP-N-acetylmuramoylalanine--D-glutamate ligase